MKQIGYGQRNIGRLRLVIVGLMVTLSIFRLLGIYSRELYLHNEDACQRLHMKEAYSKFDAKVLAKRVAEVLEKMEGFQNKLEYAIQEMEKDRDRLRNANISRTEFKTYLENEVVRPLSEAHVSLRQIRLPRPLKKEPSINNFDSEEMRKYITPKENKKGKMNIYKTTRVFNTIGHTCVLYKKEVEEYMSYEVGGYCKDDWNLAQKLMLHGCDPLPRRRCLTRSPKLYLKPYPINEKVKWVIKSEFSVDFLISEVLDIKQGEIRIGLDYSVDFGTFGARMRERNITIIVTALNLGAPFSEMIGIRGLIPLYVTPNQRLPFFDNTMDLVHTTGVLDGWIDLMLLDFVLFDWDRILRPGGLLWVDRFFCNKDDLEDYMYMFLKFRYKRHKWVVAKKSKDEVYLSALLEKPRRSV